LTVRRCAGPGCFSCCVEKLPGLFTFDPVTNAARCSVSTSVVRPDWEYPLYQAVAQCPRSCIHYVTPGQLNVLTDELSSAVEGRADVDAVAYTLYELLVRTTRSCARWQLVKRQDEPR
jgi:ferredoxin